MIERNLGNVERVLRLVLGVAIFTWAWRQGAMNPVEWFVMLVSIALVLNGIFSRCYLWYLLEINTCRRGESDCPTESTCT